MSSLLLSMLGIAAVAGRLPAFAGQWWGRRGDPQAVPDVSVPAPPSSAASRFEQVLAQGGPDAVIREMDRVLPELPVAATLIEAARALFDLQRDIATARAAGTYAALSDRLDAQAEDVAAGLWERAEHLERIARAGVSLPPAVMDELDQEDEQLQDLVAALRAARSELAAVSTAGGRRDLAAAERRLRALAATAQELRELDR